MTWAKVLDQTRCIGCHACSTACKAENGVPLGVHRTFVKAVEVGAFPAVRRAYQVTRCNQCEDAPCTTACPTRAMYRRKDGIVDFDKSVCIGCKACIAACPYDAIFINPDDHSAEKCNLCSHRIDAGLEPACVTVCPTNAIIVGELDDLRTPEMRVRRPDKETHPKVMYRAATPEALDPLGARRPAGGLWQWGEQGGERLASAKNQAAMVVHDVAHRAPWDWRVSLYTWTKGISAGAYLVGLVLRVWFAPWIAMAALAATGAILIADLEHPLRFYLIFTRRQWKSWLVRGAFVIGGYGAALAGQILIPSWWWAIAGAPLAAFTAIYTAFLFAQARGRDLWQSRLLAPHLLVQAVVAGAAVLGLAGVADAGWILAGATIVHLGFLGIELRGPHATAHAQLAAENMIARSSFADGVAIAAFAITAPWLPFGPPLAALIGLFLTEHAHIAAGQAVPLA